MLLMAFYFDNFNVSSSGSFNNNFSAKFDDSTVNTLSSTFVLVPSFANF